MPLVLTVPRAVLDVVMLLLMVLGAGSRSAVKAAINGGRVVD